MARSDSTPADGSTFIAALLLTSLALVGLLTWQAQDAARSHRTVAEGVLRDYATLAADEFVRRAVSQVGYYGYYNLISALGQRETAAPLLSPTDLAAEERTARAAPLASSVFRFDPTLRTFSFSPFPPSPAVLTELQDHLIQAQKLESSEDEAYGVLHSRVGAQRHTFIYSWQVVEAGRRFALGFEVDPKELSNWLLAVFEREPLLPPSLAEGNLSNEMLSLWVGEPGGSALFETGLPPMTPPEDEYAPDLSVEMPFGDRYQGILEGLVVRVVLDPKAAPKMVIGGLPRSRLPGLLALLALTAGLLTTAVLQLRRARALARLRSDFVSRVSHELRTPLAQIRMFAETLLLGRVRSEEERTRSLQIIDREARRLGHLVENILQFSRQERATLRLSRQRRDLASLVDSVLEEFHTLVQGKRVKFVSHLVSDLEAYVDEDALRQVLLNLLDNAVKYGPRTQEIRVSLQRDGRVARLAVEDQGPGIPPSERKRVWQRFERLGRDRRSPVAGAGIGLSVVRELVALHGGAVSVDGSELGGAIFVVELPILGSPSESATNLETEKTAGVQE